MQNNTIIFRQFKQKSFQCKIEYCKLIMLKILIVPIGTEIGKELFLSLEHLKNIKLIGVNSCHDHSDYLGIDIVDHNFPYVSDSSFESAIHKLVSDYKIDIIIPAHDDALYAMPRINPKCKWLGPQTHQLASLLRNKRLTLEALSSICPSPYVFDSIDDVREYPVFIKPNCGQGSRGAFKAKNKEALTSHADSLENNDILIQEFLPGGEVTVECFSDIDSNLVYSLARNRNTISNGISIRNSIITCDAELETYAKNISLALSITGAWFFQLKKNAKGIYHLLEVANRIPGASCESRFRGINLTEMWIYQTLGHKVKKPVMNQAYISVSKSMYPIIKIDYQPDMIYVDYDDTLIFSNGTLNYNLVGLLYGIKNKLKIPLVVISRHKGDLVNAIKDNGLSALFDQVIHITDGTPKSNYINVKRFIFVDDSYQERADIREFHPDGVCLTPSNQLVIEGLL